MNKPLCTALDDYLGHELHGYEIAQFTAHLSGCLACQHAVKGNERLKDLLAVAIAELEPVPAGLIQRVEKRIRAVRRQRLAVLGTVLTGAAIVVCIVGRNVVIRNVPEEARVVTQSEELENVTTESQQVHVVFPNTSHLMVGPAMAESPNITVIRIYQGLRKSSASTPERPPEGGNLMR